MSCLNKNKRKGSFWRLRNPFGADVAVASRGHYCSSPEKPSCRSLPFAFPSLPNKLLEYIFPFSSFFKNTANLLIHHILPVSTCTVLSSQLFFLHPNLCGMSFRLGLQTRHCGLQHLLFAFCGYRMFHVFFILFFFLLNPPRMSLWPQVVFTYCHVPGFSFLARDCFSLIILTKSVDVRLQ